MKAGATCFTNHALHHDLFFSPSPPINIRTPRLSFSISRASFLSFKHGPTRHSDRAVGGGERTHVSQLVWDELLILENGKRAYLDEADVVSLLDPPKELIPLDPASYNPASYLWKKIEDIPDERRHRLLSLLEPRLVSRAWGIAGTRYQDPKLSLAKKNKSSLMSAETGADASLTFYSCRSNGGPFPICWMKSFRKALFHHGNGKTYGRFIGESVLGQIANTFAPLYFTVTEHKEVMSTEQPCDLAYEFGDECLNLHSYPQGFPKAVKHPYPFNDQVVIYIRHIGPGVLVGQAWQEGRELQQVPKRLCGDILMVENMLQLEKIR